MYEKFLDKSLNSTRQMADAAFIAQYANVVSEKIIELWKEVGLGTFCDGLFRIIEPDKYQSDDLCGRCQRVSTFCGWRVFEGKWKPV